MNKAYKSVDSAPLQLMPVSRLRGKILLQLGIACGVVLLTGILVYQMLLQQQLREVVRQQDEQLTEAVSLLSREFGDINHMIRLLYKSRVLQDTLQMTSTDYSGLDDYFLQFASSSEKLLQIRWLDLQGMERVRVEQQQINNKPAWQSVSRLQDKSQRYYYLDAMKVKPPEIYISPVDLNVEHGEVVVPHQATLRAGLQTGVDDALQPGLLLVNYHLNQVFANIRALQTDHSRISMVNNKGYWLIHANPAVEWGADLNQSQHNLQLAQPELWSAMSQHSAELSVEYDQSLVSYRSINFSGSYDRQQRSQLFLIAETPPDILSQYKYEALWPTLLTVIGLLSLTFWVIWRDYQYRLQLLQLNQQLAADKAKLLATNVELDQVLQQQQMLQEDLVESRKLSSLGMMVAGVAHELNTPIGGALMAISTQVQRLKALRTLVQEGLTRNALNQYLNSAEEGLKLAEQNLNNSADLVKRFKRLAIDRVREENIDFSLKQVIDDLLLSLQPRLKKSGVHVTCLLEDDLQLHNDPGILSQLLQNLIVNALTHGLANKMQGKIMIKACCLASGWVEITVKDNGDGIAPDIRAHIFDPFVTSNRGNGSTGLGLHFVHQWVTQVLRGRISIEEATEGGACFKVCFPK